MYPSAVGPSPTTHQPQSMGMMQPMGMMVVQPGMAQPVPGFPPGLEALAQTNEVIIEQKMELLEAITGFETKNKYAVKTSLGQTLFFAAEKSSLCARCCCGRNRPFHMAVFDAGQREVLSFERPLRCQGCACCPGDCEQVIEVSANGMPLGSVHEEWAWCKPSYTVRDAQNQVRLRVTGPCCVCKCCTDIDFPVLSADADTQVGTITKKWGGMTKEVFTDCKTFTIAFPQGLDGATKCTLFAAAFLIGYNYYERDKNN